MKNSRKTVALVILTVCIAALLSSCMLLASTPVPAPAPAPAPETRYEVVGNWRRTAGQFNSTITYYMKADGTYSYSNNQNGDLDSGEYTVDWSSHTIRTNHQMNHSLDKSISFRFSGPDTLYLDDYAYTRIK